MNNYDLAVFEGLDQCLDEDIVRLLKAINDGESIHFHDRSAWSRHSESGWPQYWALPEEDRAEVRDLGTHKFDHIWMRRSPGYQMVLQTQYGGYLEGLKKLQDHQVPGSEVRARLRNIVTSLMRYRGIDGGWPLQKIQKSGPKVHSPFHAVQFRLLLVLRSLRRQR